MAEANKIVAFPPAMTDFESRVYDLVEMMSLTEMAVDAIAEGDSLNRAQFAVKHMSQMLKTFRDQYLEAAFAHARPTAAKAKLV